MAFFLKKTDKILVNNLEEKVEYYGGKKGLILIQQSDKNIQTFLKKMLLRVAKMIFKSENTWKTLKPWWFLLRKMYNKDTIEK